MCQRLLNKNAIVTGAARGMGFAIARALFREGARVAILDIDERGVADASAQLDPNGTRILGRRVDVTQKEEIQSWVKEMKAIWGGCGHTGQQCRWSAQHTLCAR